MHRLCLYNLLIKLWNRECDLFVFHCIYINKLKCTFTLYNLFLYKSYVFKQLWEGTYKGCV